MPQKILAGRAVDPQLRGDLVQVKVDQIILSRSPGRTLGEALALGMKKTPVELAVAYEGTCVTDARSLAEVEGGAPRAVLPEFPAHNVPIARGGIGFPAPVHLERFAAPARFAVTDDMRLAPVGGIGMLTLVVSPAQLGQALATGSVWVRPPRSVQVHLSGRVRPFVCARDIALELLRRGIDDVVGRIEAEHHAPVVLEFAGPSARLISVSDRAVLCGIAPRVGAAAALFVSDEKTEVFLRDQRRSKAYRALVPDPGAPCEEVMSIDLATVDPLLMDETGTVRPVRDLAGKPVSQVVLGGDSGATLRDMLVAAMLLKSKRLPPRLDLIVAPPSRQVLEVLAQSGALADLVATGARIIEPDRRVAQGDLYPPPPAGLSLRTSDPAPRIAGSAQFVVASAETLAYAVATGAVGDPRSFKRPVRVTVPRALPTDDVLVLRDKKGDGTAPGKAPVLAAISAWKAAATLDVVRGIRHTPDSVAVGQGAPVAPSSAGGIVLLLQSVDEVRATADSMIELTTLRAVVAPLIPSAIVTIFASEGVAAFSADASTLETLSNGKTLALPEPSQWSNKVRATVGEQTIDLGWLAVGPERAWTHAGSSRPAPSGKGSKA